MAYPNFQNKHLEQALFSSEDFIKYAYKTKKKFPEKYIIVFQRSVEQYIRKKFRLKRVKDNFFSRNLYLKGKLGFMKVEGIGSPHAVTVFEELIGIGGKEFLVVGTAGGLQSFGNFLCDKAIRDEGTSSHYLPHEKYAYPDASLSEKFGKSIQKQGLGFQKGATWTIDAPYRETKTEIVHYKREGIKTVEMEASALFAVARVRKVKIAAAFVVSDLIGTETWDPQFHKKHVKANLNKLVDAAAHCLSER